MPRDDVDLYTPGFTWRTRRSCGCETVVVWDRDALDYVALDPEWRWTSDAHFSCGAPGHAQASSEAIVRERRNGLEVM